MKLLIFNFVEVINKLTKGGKFVVEFSNDLIIHSELNNVFRTLEKLENFPKWNYAVKEITEIDSKGNKVGSQYKLSREVGSQKSEVITIKDYIQNRRLSFEAIGNMFSYTSTYELTQHPQGTSLINSIVLQLSGVKRIALSIIQGNIKSAVNKNLNVLKRMVEEKYPI